jgi:uncharacterized coiled-coil protein SlyX
MTATFCPECGGMTGGFIHMSPPPPPCRCWINTTFNLPEKSNDPSLEERIRVLEEKIGTQDDKLQDVEKQELVWSHHCPDDMRHGDIYLVRLLKDDSQVEAGKLDIKTHPTPIFSCTGRKLCFYIDEIKEWGPRVYRSVGSKKK